MITLPAPGYAALVLIADTLDDGTPRALGRWGRASTVEHLVAVLAPLFETVVVVLGSGGEKVAAATELGDVVLVIDPEWDEGVASPLRAGLDTLSRQPEVAHAVVIDATTPQVDADLLNDLVAAHAATPHALPGRRIGDGAATVGKFRYARSGPIVLARELWERFLSMEGATPILQVLSVRPDWVTEVWIDQLPPVEVHDADDLARVAPRT